MRIRTIFLATLIAAMLLLTVTGAAFAQQAPGRGGDNNNNGPRACTGRGRRACEIPEVPVAAAIPAVGLLGIAGYVIVDRRRRRKVDTPTA